MSSQTDLDQGGTYRQFTRLWLGPSVGWVDYPVTARLNVTSASATVARGTTFVACSYNGNVAIQLPSSLQSAAGAQALPAEFITVDTVVMDVGGLSSDVNVITITPYGSELINGQASVTIETAYGAVVLRPQLDTGGWELLQ